MLCAPHFSAFGVWRRAACGGCCLSHACSAGKRRNLISMLAVIDRVLATAVPLGSHEVLHRPKSVSGWGKYLAPILRGFSFHGRPLDVRTRVRRRCEAMGVGTVTGVNVEEQTALLLLFG